MYALSFRNSNANVEIVHLDLSSASIKIAQQRAAFYDFRTITFKQGSILEVAKYNLGKFDFIDSVGVLHHLAEPVEGFRALEAVLKEDGGMLIMLYATLGRMGECLCARECEFVNMIFYFWGVRVRTYPQTHPHDATHAHESHTHTHNRSVPLPGRIPPAGHPSQR